MHTNLLRIHNLGLCNGNRMSNIVNSLEYVIKFINKREINLLIITGFMPDSLSRCVQKLLDDFFNSICSSVYLCTNTYSNIPFKTQNLEKIDKKYSLL